MRILVTNDDGVDSVGIHVLAAALAASGEHQVLVVAPSTDQSGTGAALGRFSSSEDVDARRVELPGAPGVEAWALPGPPGMCVLAAVLGGFADRPELVVSGINAGANTGRATLHSGTVGAVLTGQNLGLSGLAVSVQAGETWHWDTAAAITLEVLPQLLASPPRSALNLNVPALPRTEVQGIAWGHLAPFGEVRAAVTGAASPDEARRGLRMELRLHDHAFEPDTDQGLVRAGWASLTALVGVVEAWPDDEGLTDKDVALDLAEALAPGAPLHAAHRVPDAAIARLLPRRLT